MSRRLSFSARSTVRSMVEAVEIEKQKWTHKAVECRTWFARWVGSLVVNSSKLRVHIDPSVARDGSKSLWWYYARARQERNPCQHDSDDVLFRGQNGCREIWSCSDRLNKRVSPSPAIRLLSCIAPPAAHVILFLLFVGRTRCSSALLLQSRSWGTPWFLTLFFLRNHYVIHDPRTPVSRSAPRSCRSRLTASSVCQSLLARFCHPRKAPKGTSFVLNLKSSVTSSSSCGMQSCWIVSALGTWISFLWTLKTSMHLAQEICFNLQSPKGWFEADLFTSLT